ncbi:lytic murein transglycosylase [Mesorhizobium ephedrae]|uniref:Lytic murein transglycosylase n=1 Tax=Kumtagia ephedrae TaxID=2116701 RepID=A0A2P7S4Z6_9HYPH|nr:lytic murein transglycosylase [Mesorhizobium ephedrae]
MLFRTPLCPAGHLPRKGGDRLAALLSPIADAAECGRRAKLPISPLAGEMSGRTEGGAQDPGRNAATTA